MYSFCSIDYDWSRLPTVKDYLQDHLFKEQLSHHSKATMGDFYRNMHLSFTEAQHIASALKACLEYSKKNLCWDGTFCEEPRIFFVPAVKCSWGFEFGFAWKITNNGSAYVASPIERPDIFDQCGADHGVVEIGRMSE